MGSNNSRARRMAEESISHSMSDESDSDQEIDYAAILQSLINSSRFSGSVHIVSSHYDDGDPEFGPPPPRIRYKPNTSVLDTSEFSMITRQASGAGMPRRLSTVKVKNHSYYSMLLNRQNGIYKHGSFSATNKCRIGNLFLPNQMTVHDSYSGKAFCGIYSKDGSLFMVASQDKRIRLYNANVLDYPLDCSFYAIDVGWSILDLAFSPDCQRFVYSTWSSSLHLCTIDKDADKQEPLCLVNTGRRFCVFSVMFSSDGKEILGGANDGCIYAYNLERSQTSKILAHEYDVNSVAFADSSTNIIYSGGDDGLVKVWDRRTLNESDPNPVGVLAGHLDGITFIDSKNDGRHLISNSKDQSIKLWDVRVFSSSAAAENTLRAVHDQSWDYRWQEVPRKLYSSKNKLSGDTSIMTYKGHVVVKTLVRCRFSPMHQTGQRFIYTGCGSGRVVIYDSLTGKIVRSLPGHTACVRDVSWHPYKNELMSSSWDTVVGRWEYYRSEPIDLQLNDRDSSVENNDNKEIPPPRRSLRIALKRQREHTPSKTPLNQQQ